MQLRILSWQLHVCAMISKPPSPIFPHRYNSNAAWRMNPLNAMSVGCKLADDKEEEAEAAVVAAVVDVSLPEEEGQEEVVVAGAIFTLVLIHQTNGQRYPMKINNVLETVVLPLLQINRNNSKLDRSAPSLPSRMRALMMPFRR